MTLEIMNFYMKIMNIVLIGLFGELNLEIVFIIHIESVNLQIFSIK